MRDEIGRQNYYFLIFFGWVRHDFWGDFLTRHPPRLRLGRSTTWADEAESRPRWLGKEEEEEEEEEEEGEEEKEGEDKEEKRRERTEL